MTKVNFPKVGEKYKFEPLFTAKRAMKLQPRIPRKVILIYSNTLERKIRN
jgi:hypothetical protein